MGPWQDSVLGVSGWERLLSVLGSPFSACSRDTAVGAGSLTVNCELSTANWMTRITYPHGLSACSTLTRLPSCHEEYADYRACEREQPHTNIRAAGINDPSEERWTDAETDEESEQHDA